MKTTVEIPDALFREVRNYAHAHSLSFRQVVETGLRRVIDSDNVSAAPFRLEKRSFCGDGTFNDYAWPHVRALIYEGRGE